MATKKSNTTKKTTSAKKTTTTKKATGAAKKTTKRRITAEDIRVRAAQIYEERVHQGQQGDELSDWLQAEKELSTSTK